MMPMLLNKPPMLTELLNTNQSQTLSPSSSQNYNPYLNNHNNQRKSYQPNQPKLVTLTQSPLWLLLLLLQTKVPQLTLLLNYKLSKTQSKPPQKPIKPPKLNLTVISTLWFQKSLLLEPPTNKNQKLKKLPQLITKTKLKPYKPPLITILLLETKISNY